jgi:lysophospholipase L1-like esterase
LPVRRKILFSAIVVMAALVLLESGARLLVQGPRNSRWQYHRRLIDSVGFPALNDVMVPDPVLFWALRPNLDRKVIAGRIAAGSDLDFGVSTDAQGSRRTPVATGARRSVVFLGDSCTFGIGVNDDQTFAALVQQRLPGIQAINLGVPGYTAYQGRLRLNDYAFAVAPAAVVITFGFNDEAVWDNRDDLEHAAMLRAQHSWVNSSRFIGWLGGLLSRPAPAAPAPAGTRRPRLTDEEFVDALQGMVEWCRGRHAQPVLMVWPYRAQLTRSDMSPKQRLVVYFAARQGAPLVNLIPAFRHEGGESLFLDVIHASAAGHVVVARALEASLRNAFTAQAGARR